MSFSFFGGMMFVSGACNCSSALCGGRGFRYDRDMFKKSFSQNYENEDEFIKICSNVKDRRKRTMVSDEGKCIVIVYVVRKFA
jgi:hypothetical protein